MTDFRFPRDEREEVLALHSMLSEYNFELANHAGSKVWSVYLETRRIAFGTEDASNTHKLRILEEFTRSLPKPYGWSLTIPTFEPLSVDEAENKIGTNLIYGLCQYGPFEEHHESAWDWTQNLFLLIGDDLRTYSIPNLCDGIEATFVEQYVLLGATHVALITFADED